ncbi:MAG: hypothetical protein K2G87_12500, partial [Oscillospiraceae bacterium]|nr:hypothetical protein [Oscillospiraceae bacterium]
MQENLTSSEALHDERISAGAEKRAETAVSEPRGKTVSFGDTLTLQAILCVLLAIGFVAVNILNGDMAADIFELYESKFNSESTVVEVFAAIADFLGSA